MLSRTFDSYFLKYYFLFTKGFYHLNNFLNIKIYYMVKYKTDFAIKDICIVLLLVVSSISFGQNCIGGQVYNGYSKICLNGSTGNMTLGGNVVGNVKRWEKKLTTANTWTSIANTTTTYSENPSVSGTWQYRAVVGSGSCEAFSEPFNVEVNPALTISLVNPNLVTCLGASSVNLEYTASTGSQAGKIVFNNAPGIGDGSTNYFTTSASGGIKQIPLYFPAPGTYTGTLSLLSDYPLCTGTTTYPITITIGSTAVGGTVSAPQTICAGSMPQDLTLTGNTGSVVKWQKSNVQDFTSGVTDIASTSTILSGSAMGPISENTYFRAVVSSCTVAYSTPVLITVGTTSTYSNGSWSNGIPNASNSLSAIIASDYNTTNATGSFSACNCTINSGVTLTVATASSATIKNNLINNGAILVNNGGNLLQGTGATYYGTGTFTVKKTTASAADRYNFWSSPTAAQNMFAIFPTASQYVMTYNTATDYYNVLANPATATAGVGYSIKTPAGGAQATFSGIPNTGIKTVSLSTAGNRYNLVGNPYPSNISLTSFYTTNSTKIEPTLYFWDNTAAYQTTQTGAQVGKVNGYATFNASGSGTWVPANSTSGTAIAIATNAAPVATIGQGFLVDAKSTSLTFDNSMRIATAGTFFNKTSTSTTVGKYWLKLKTPYNANTVLAITYGEGAQNTLDAFDSEAISIGDDAFYSILGSSELSIQGKDDFVPTDVVPVAAKHFEAGLHEISLVNTQGIFANNGQAIILHDKELGTYTDLQNGAYNYMATAGLSANRFEIVYMQSVLATQNTVKPQVEVYKDGQQFVVKAPQNITEIKVLDVSGRLIMSLIPNAKTSVITGLSRGIYLLNIQTGNTMITKKISH